MRIVVLPFALLAIALLGCSGDKSPSGCNTAKECSAGHTCQAKKCVQLCDDQTPCAAGTACNEDGICEAATGAPVLNEVRGTGSTACSTAASGTCFTDRWVIEGGQLASATFTLEGEQNFALNVIEIPNTSSVVVALPAGLVPGSYNLKAVNASGSAALGVNVLQGEPGPDATGNELLSRINDDATTSFVVERMPAANALITHLNTGSGSVKLSANILPAASGGGTPTGNEIIDLINGATGVIQSARVEGAGGGGGRLVHVHTWDQANAGGTSKSIAISRATLLDYCGAPGGAKDTDGCDVRLGYTYYDFDGSGTRYAAQSAITWGPVCRLSIGDDGSWSVPAECSQVNVVWDGRKICAGGSNVGLACDANSDCPSSTCTAEPYNWVCNGGTNNGDGCNSDADCPSGWCGPVTRWFSSYSTASSGKDNNNATANQTLVPGGKETVLRYFAYDRFACSFADFNTTSGLDAGDSDTDDNFYFWLHKPLGDNDSSSAGANYSSSHFNSTSRACVLLIDD